MTGPSGPRPSRPRSRPAPRRGGSVTAGAVVGSLAVALVAWPAPVLAVHGGADPPATISAEDLDRLLGAGQPVVTIDLRPRDAYRHGHLPGARSLPLDQLRGRLDEVPQAGRVVLYGGTEAEAATAYGALRLRGHRNVTVLDGGLAGWTRRGLPLEPAP